MSTGTVRTSLLTMREASRLLGVSEPTLRHWTDQGEIEAFITPGGHRRYAEADIVSLLKRKQERPPPEHIAAALKEVTPREHQVVADYLFSTRWYPRLGEAGRRQLRERGGRLLEIVIRYVTEPAQREQAAAEAADIGREYGLQLSSLGLSVSEAIEAFVLHRVPLLDAASRLLRNRSTISKGTQEALLQVSNLTDQVLLALLKVYQQSEQPVRRVRARVRR
ncbi:MAG: helix-turn-helix domain-containing protein [Dehalococcoidia bacterium]|nr:helix-turn-helix domain-containing protein [Dehalococcoidia bacterium]